MKPTRTWILIADASRARVYLHAGPQSGLQAVEGMTMNFDHKQTRELGDDKPGRTFESVGSTRHAVSPRTDPERIEEQRFVARIVDRLDKEAMQSSFDRLIVVAPPTMLGDLRQALSPRLAARLDATLDKDLTKTPVVKLPEHLSSVLPV